LVRAPVPEKPLDFIRECLFRREVRWTYHVTMRLKRRSLGREILMKAADLLEIIESYPDDKYLPSFLLRGVSEDLVFHAVIAADVQGGNVRIVTMYSPAPEEWDSEYRVRKVQS
jgi:hypothetical protein